MRRVSFAALAILILLSAPVMTLRAETKIPDLTRGGKPDKTHDWTLGPTGARGWIWGWKGHTTKARQILITEVAEGSPADGVLTKGDVILGVGSEAFDHDARLLLAQAITEAEQEKNKGILRLQIWRDGKPSQVELKLPVMGTYSATAPYDCEKSKRILKQGCDAIAKLGWKDKRGKTRISIPNDMNALLLLASGDENYKPLVAEYARAVADHTPGGYVSWGYGYQVIFLAEYAAATRDASVMDGLKRLALDIARGQSGVGTWGHRFARPDLRLNGYGAMNQPGITLSLAMVISREAGIKDPVLDKAIDTATGFLHWYVDKGAIPYGDHKPWSWHDDNGKCSSAAVLFDLVKDQKAAGYFSRMGLAAHSERESGHTGNFFNVTWAMPGVSRSGPQATSAYFKEQAWYYDLARRWDGRVLYQPTPGDWGGHAYNLWDCTGAYLLGYALPLKKTYVTGKNPSVVPPLSAQAVAETIESGRGFTYWKQNDSYIGRSAEKLLAGLTSWSPSVRKRSAHALSKTEGDFVPKLIEMLDSQERYTRYGACEALGLLGPKANAAGPKLLKLLESKDVWLKCLAAEALAKLGPEVQKAAVPELLRLTVREDPEDPRRMIQRSASAALFSKGMLADSLEGVDRELLYPAVQAVLENEDGRTRGAIQRLYGKLNDRDLATLLPAIVKAVKEPAPSGEMFADGIRLAGLDLLSRLHIREGMDLCFSLMEPDRWGQGRRIPKCVSFLKRYGGNAESFLPQLREMRQTAIKKDRKNREKGALPVALEKTINAIEKDQNPPRLRSLEEFIQSPGKP